MPKNKKGKTFKKKGIRTRKPTVEKDGVVARRHAKTKRHDGKKKRTFHRPTEKPMSSSEKKKVADKEQQRRVRSLPVANEFDIDFRVDVHAHSRGIVAETFGIDTSSIADEITGDDGHPSSKE